LENALKRTKKRIIDGELILAEGIFYCNYCKRQKSGSEQYGEYSLSCKDCKPKQLKNNATSREKQKAEKWKKEEEVAAEMKARWSKPFGAPTQMMCQAPKITKQSSTAYTHYGLNELDDSSFFKHTQQSNCYNQKKEHKKEMDVRFVLLQPIWLRTG